MSHGVTGVSQLLRDSGAQWGDPDGCVWFTQVNSGVQHSAALQSSAPGRGVDPRSVSCPQSDRATGRARMRAEEGGSDLEKGLAGAGSGTRASAVVRRCLLGLEPRVGNMEMDLDEPEMAMEPVHRFGVY